MTTGARRASWITWAACAWLLALSCCNDALLGRLAGRCASGECDDASAPVGDAAAEATPDAAACPPVSLPICEAGTAVARYEGNCVAGYRCEVACGSRDGQCQAVEACSNGRWRDGEPSDCASGTICCEPCLPIAAPPADYCDGGPIESVYEGNCVVSFRCP